MISILSFIGLIAIIGIKYTQEEFTPFTIPQVQLQRNEKALKEQLKKLPLERLEKMKRAGEKMKRWNGIMEKTKGNIISNVLKNQGTFYQMMHYPKGDVYDAESQSHYFYHSHRENEYGHFHLFLHKKQTFEDNVFVHLIAVSIDKNGLPKTLFTTNQWVTGEQWHQAEEIIPLIDEFNIGHAYPSWPANRWLSSIVQLFYPQIVTLITQRDEVLEKYSSLDILQDRHLEVITETPISLQQQIDLIDEVIDELYRQTNVKIDLGEAQKSSSI